MKHLADLNGKYQDGNWLSGQPEVGANQAELRAYLGIEAFTPINNLPENGLFNAPEPPVKLTSAGAAYFAEALTKMEDKLKNPPKTMICYKEPGQQNRKGYLDLNSRVNFIVETERNGNFRIVSAHHMNKDKAFMKKVTGIAKNELELGPNFNSNKNRPNTFDTNAH